MFNSKYPCVYGTTESFIGDNMDMEDTFHTVVGEFNKEYCISHNIVFMNGFSSANTVDHPEFNMFDYVNTFTKKKTTTIVKKDTLDPEKMDVGPIKAPNDAPFPVKELKQTSDVSDTSVLVDGQSCLAIGCECGEIFKNLGNLNRHKKHSCALIKNKSVRPDNIRRKNCVPL